MVGECLWGSGLPSKQVSVFTNSPSFLLESVGPKFGLFALPAPPPPQPTALLFEKSLFCHFMLFKQCTSAVKWSH